jgi:putative oxidoreductase
MRWSSRSWVLFASSLVVGAVFVYASADKILNPEEFARIIYRYHLVGPNQVVGPLLANLIAVTLPWVELLLGILLILGAWRREAALLAGVLLVSFVLAVASTMVRGIDVENCGCFTVADTGGRRAGYGLIVGDLVLFAITVAVIKLTAPARRAAGPKAELAP